MNDAYGLHQQALNSIPQSQWSSEMQEAVAAKQAQMLGSGRAQAMGNQIKQPGLMDGLRGVHDLIDRLQGSLGNLDDRLTPVLSPCPPSPLQTGANQVSGEPPAIDEVVRMLLRLQGIVSTVESITGRVRV